MALNIVSIQKNFDIVLSAFNKNAKKSTVKKEILFTIEKGSSNYISEDLYPIIANSVNNMVDKMTPEQLTAVVILAILIFGGYFVGNLYLEYKKEVKKQDKEIELRKIEEDSRDKERKNSTEMLKMVLSDKDISKSFEKTAVAGKNLRQRIIDTTPTDSVDILEINGEELNKDEINKLKTDNEKGIEREYVVTEWFKIFDFSIPDTNKVKLTVKRESYLKDPSFYLTGNSSSKGALSEEEVGMICDAIKENKKLIRLQAKLTLRDSIAIKGEILSFTPDNEEKTD